MKLSFKSLRKLIREAIESLGAIMNLTFDDDADELNELFTTAEQNGASKRLLDNLRRAWYAHDKLSRYLLKIWQNESFRGADVWVKLIDELDHTLQQCKSATSALMSEPYEFSVADDLISSKLLRAISQERWEDALEIADSIRQSCHIALQTTILELS